VKHRIMSAVLACVLLGIGIVVGAAWNEASRRTADAAAAGPAKAAARAPAKEQPVRYGSVIGVKPEKLDEYLKLHAAAWPEVLQRLKECHFRNYSIYLGKLDDGNLYLFSYFEYTGEDLEADGKRMGADPATKRWWKLTDPCQIPQKARKPGEHWMTMQEVFHMD
jgi:L-rhamnose mutarotase